ncbi:MAG: methionine--tRNA ligase [Rickettsiales bacterium]|jgi:methionyl-tRNA synthetase|nr:methionine--tRNA ligase [Rickettsiales bacterium]
MKNFFITTPIYYVNSNPHIGSVYTTIMADIISRFKRLNDNSVFFLTGTDEHGIKIQQSAEKAGKAVLEFVDEIADIFKSTATFMNCENDDFIRTTEERHVIFVQDIWKILLKNDWLYKGKYSGWYCIGDEAYYTEDELIKNTKGEFETALGKSVEWREEESYFFRLSEFQNILLDIYLNDKNFIQPESRRNEIISFVGGGDLKKILKGEFKRDYLRDLSVSRNNFSWGIKIPQNDKGENLLNSDGNWLSDVPDEEKHVIYVWLDALFNYQSAIKSELDEFWTNADVTHIVGKDIVKFHTIYWPAFLIAAKYPRDEFKNISYNDVLKNKILPTTIFVHGFWLNEGKKMSKSFGNVVNPYNEILWLQQEFNLEKDIAVDYFRYYLSTDGIFGNDLDYSRQRFVEKINAELVNNIGNLTQRVLSMIYKNLNGKIENNLQQQNISLLPKDKTLDSFDFDGYKNFILQLANTANDYMEKTAPWRLEKEGKKEEMKKILYLQVKNIINIIVLLQPFCPTISSRVLEFLGVKDKNFNSINNRIATRTIEEPRAFFPRLSSTTRK